MAATANLRPTPRRVMDALPASVHMIDAAAIEPGVVRVTLLNSDHAVTAKTALTQAGFKVIRTHADLIVTAAA